MLKIAQYAGVIGAVGFSTVSAQQPERTELREDCERCRGQNGRQDSPKTGRKKGKTSVLLPWLIIIPFVGGLLCWLAERLGAKTPRWIALITMGLTLAISLQLWLQGGYSLTQAAGMPQWQSEFSASWIPRFGINFHLALDGLSLLMVVLTGLLGLMAVLCSWNEL